MPWQPTEPSWQVELLQRCLKGSGLDVSLVEQSMRLTYTERLENLQKLVDFIAEVRRARDHGLSSTP